MLENSSVVSTVSRESNETDEIVRNPVSRKFKIEETTEWNYKSNDEVYYGPYAHLREEIDYTYHSNYVKARQWFQDSIIEKLMGELIQTSECNSEQFSRPGLSKAPSILTKGADGIGIWSLPKNPWLIFVASTKGIDKSEGIKSLLEEAWLPIMGFVLVDPDEIHRLLPEFVVHASELNLSLAQKLARKETGYITEILTNALLEKGTNVVVYGNLTDLTWYKNYCTALKDKLKNLKIAILHIGADTETQEEINGHFDELVPHVDYFCALRIRPKENNPIKIMTDGVTTESFKSEWQQSSAWESKESALTSPLSAPGKKSNRRRYSIRTQKALRKTGSYTVFSKSSRYHDRECIIRSFSFKVSSEENHSSDDMCFYGPYAHIRKTLDYTYHKNYTRERQLLQDAIIMDTMNSPVIVDCKGDVCTTPTEPFIVFTAGAMGAGKSYTLKFLNEKGLFPLPSFVIIDPDKIRQFFPEYKLYSNQNPSQAGELTRKEAGYIVEILTLTALQAGKNVLVDGSLRDWGWYLEYFARLKREYSPIHLSILHVDAPKEAIKRRAKVRGILTGRVIPNKTLEMAMEQVPKSVEKLKDEVDSYYRLNNAPGRDIELMTVGDWKSFKEGWIQTCAWIPKQKETSKFGKFPTIKSIHLPEL